MNYKILNYNELARILLNDPNPTKSLMNSQARIIRKKLMEGDLETQIFVAKNLVKILLDVQLKNPSALSI